MKEREPVGPVQVLPPGLINWLQLKVGGLAPDALRQDIQPIIDMESWWMRATAKPLNVGQLYINQLAAGTLAEIEPLIGNVDLVALTVPNREWWYVESCVVRVYNDAATTSGPIAMGVRSIGGPSAARNNSIVGPILPSLAAATFGVVEARDFWMPPGSLLGTWVGQVAGAGLYQALLQGFRYSVLPI